MPRMVTFTEIGIDGMDIVDTESNRITWGMPAMTCQAIADRECPRCNARVEDVQYSGTQLIAGFDIHGKDGLCGCCGFAIGHAVEPGSPSGKNTGKAKQSGRTGKKAIKKRVIKKKNVNH